MMKLFFGVRKRNPSHGQHPLFLWLYHHLKNDKKVLLECLAQGLGGKVILMTQSKIYYYLISLVFSPVIAFSTLLLGSAVISAQLCEPVSSLLMCDTVPQSGMQSLQEMIGIGDQSYFQFRAKWHLLKVIRHSLKWKLNYFFLT